MSVLKKVLTLVLVAAITAGVAISGTVAYLADSDSDVNVMTVGNVKIEQIEQERVLKDDGTYEMIKSAMYGEEGYKLQPFTQGKPLYPATGKVTGWGDKVYFDQIEGAAGWQQVLDGLNNVQDKFVFVKNTGKSDAYVRTLVALEYGSNTENIVNVSIGGFWSWNEIGFVEIDNNNYLLYEAVYKGGTTRDVGGILPAGHVTPSSLNQVYLSNEATNEDCENLDGNKNGTYEILVLSQAVQADGFADAETALDTAFGKTAENAAEWFGGVWKDYQDNLAPDDKPAPANAEAEYNGTTYDTIYDAVAAANANGGGEIILKGSAKLDKPVEIKSNITINGAKAAYTREGYTGTMFTVKNGATLTMENVTLDGDGTAAIGNLIATEGNGSIVLNAGTVLKNNNGAHAVSLATRGGGTLTLNGAQIINNSSDSGAIWGGGHIIINEGSKINGNSSTGSAGAIRMVGKCNLTMNGGEICNNTAAGDGGAIWGYGVNGNTSVYNLNGGKISGNTANGTGGAIYTGTYSTVNISGDFELCDNKAANSGAIRLTNYTTLNMTGGKISGNESTGDEKCDGFYGWCPILTISGGELADNIWLEGGHTPTVGGSGITGTVYFNIGTNHNTINLAKDFGTIKFVAVEGDNFSAFNFKPADGYTYTDGDEEKLVCLNEGYSTYWDAATGAFRLQAN